MADFKSVSLADQVFDKLENDIIVGIYPRGEVLTELKLVEQLGVSRTPIREALRRLEQERLIAESGKGSIVLGITEDDLLDIMNIRESVEGLAAYYATVNITEEGRADLMHIVDLQDFYYGKGDLDRRYRRVSMDDPERVTNTLKEHRAICEAIVAGNAELAQQLTARHIANAKEHMIARFNYHG